MIEPKCKRCSALAERHPSQDGAINGCGRTEADVLRDRIEELECQVSLCAHDAESRWEVIDGRHRFLRYECRVCGFVLPAEDMRSATFIPYPRSVGESDESRACLAVCGRCGRPRGDWAHRPGGADVAAHRFVPREGEPA